MEKNTSKKIMGNPVAISEYKKAMVTSKTIILGRMFKEEMGQKKFTLRSYDCIPLLQAILDHLEDIIAAEKFATPFPKTKKGNFCNFLTGAIFEDNYRSCIQQ